MQLGLTLAVVLCAAAAVIGAQPPVYVQHNYYLGPSCTGQYYTEWYKNATCSRITGGTSQMLTITGATTLRECTFTDGQCQSAPTCSITYTQNVCGFSAHKWTWPASFPAWVDKMDTATNCGADSSGFISFPANRTCISSIANSLTYEIFTNQLRKCFYTASTTCGNTPVCTLFTNNVCQTNTRHSFTANTTPLPLPPSSSGASSLSSSSSSSTGDASSAQSILSGLAPVVLCSVVVNTLLSMYL